MAKNRWNEYEKLVLFELSENKKRIESMAKAVEELRSDVSGLKVKSTMVGGAAGLICTAILSAILKPWR